MKPRLSLFIIKRHFEKVYPELHGRLRTYSKRFADRYEALAEMTAFAWSNLVQKAKRTGQLLCAGALAWVSYRRHCSGRTMAAHGNSLKDVLSPACYRSGRVHVYRLSHIVTPRGAHAEPDEMGSSIASMLSTRERDRPDNRAAVRIDWCAFSARLPWRERRIVKWLALGFSKTEISRRLKLTNGRISQILRVIGEELRAFFGPEFIPLVA
jgi:hypothetical protein